MNALSVVLSRCRRASAFNRRSHALALAAAAGLSASLPCSADVWDNSIGDTLWSTASNWADDSEPSLANSDNVFFPAGFPGGDSAIFLDNSPVETAVGVFFSDNYFLGGGRLELFSPGNIGVDPGNTATVNSLLQNFSGLTKVGSGKLVLGHSLNTFTGTVSVSAGTLNPVTPGSIGSSPVVVSPGATIEINGAHFTQSLALNAATLRGLALSTWSGTITVGSGNSSLVSGVGSETLTIGNAADDLTGGASGTLVVSGSGAVVLPFSNNYSGGWEVTGGTLRANNSGSLGTGTTPIVVTGSGKLEIANATSLTRGLTLNNGATVTLQGGTASITGTTSIASGAAVNFTIAGGFTTLDIGDASAGLSGGGGGSSITFDNGFFVLGFASSYTGSLIASNGSVRVGADAQFGNAANPISASNALLGILPDNGAVNSTRSITNLGGSSLSAASGSTWTLNGSLTSSGVLFAQGDGNVVINGPQSYAVGSSLTLNGGVGMVTLATNAGSPAAKNLTVNVSFSNVTFDSTQHLAALNISSSRTATLTASGAKVIVADTVSVPGSAKLDLKDNKLLTTSAIGTWNGSTYTGISGRIRSGRNGGTWNGGGIITSQSDALTNLTTLGVSTGAIARFLTGTQTTIWAGQTINASSVMVMYCYTGDSNLDGIIDGTDYFYIDNNVGTSADGYGNGDFNYDGIIDGTDYFYIDSNIVDQGPPLFASGGAELLAGAAAVPEPSTIGLLATGVALLQRRRRR